jgi:serine/threonine protein kinase
MVGSAKNRHRFFREAQLTAQLEHPGIVPVYDYEASADGGRCYYTMRFIRGRTLSEVIRSYHSQRETGDKVHMSELIKLLGAFISI